MRRDGEERGAHMRASVSRGARGEPRPRPAFPGRADTHALDKEFRAAPRRQQPRPGAGVSHPRSPVPCCRGPAQVGNKINPRVSMGATGEGGSKGKGPRRREGKRPARAISPPLHSPHSPHLAPAPAPLPSQPQILPSRIFQPYPEGIPGQTPPHPTKIPGLGWEGPEGVLAPPSLSLPPSHPASLRLSFAIREMGVQGLDPQRFSIVPSSSPLTFWDSQGQGPVVFPLTACPVFTGD